MYFDVFGTEIPVDFAFPAVSPMIIGAEVAQTIADHADSEDGVALGADVAKAMAAASLDQLCDNSMLQGVSSIFRGYKDNAQIVTAVLDGMAENTASRLTPASIRAVAKYTDPYVRDTKSQNGIRELLNAQIIQNWPILRQTLPKAQTLTGEDMLQTARTAGKRTSKTRRCTSSTVLLRRGRREARRRTKSSTNWLSWPIRRRDELSAGQAGGRKQVQRDDQQDAGQGA